MKPKVMIVDDEAVIREFVKIYLEGIGYEVSEAADAAALKSFYGGPQPDVVLLDLKLPDADGLTLLPQMKKNWPVAAFCRRMKAPMTASGTLYRATSLSLACRNGFSTTNR